MSRKNIKLKCFIFVLLSFFLIIVSISIPYDVLRILDNGAVLTEVEFNNLKNNNFSLLGCVTASSLDDTITDDEIKPYIVKYKLFDLINVKQLKVNVVSTSEIYAGGECLGFSLNSNGSIVVGSNYVLTKDGKANPFKESGLNVGDLIIEIDGHKTKCTADITDYMKTFNADIINLKAIRNGEIVEFQIQPAFDIQTQTFKLGIWLKDSCAGIGTLTYINGETDEFGALGHAVTIMENEEPVSINGGNLYNCKIVGVKSGESGSAGQLLGVFSLNDKKIGTITENTKYGVYGILSDYDDLIEDDKPIDVGGKLTAKPGKAQILSCIDGENIETFDIEIIKTNYQKNSSEKSMVIRVIDKDLLNRTGGIVQGMSGSPIIQNGKLVGAVTHVFINDPSKGFGLYIDWML